METNVLRKYTGKIAEWKNYKVSIKTVCSTQWNECNNLNKGMFLWNLKTRGRDEKILIGYRKKNTFSCRDTEFKTNSYHLKSMYNGREIKTDSSPASKTLEARNTMGYALRVGKGNYFHPGSLCSSDLSNEEKIKTSSVTQWLKTLIPSAPFLSDLVSFSLLNIPLWTLSLKFAPLFETDCCFIGLSQNFSRLLTALRLEP